MPSASRSQQIHMCIAFKIKKGEYPESYSKKAAETAKGMSLSDLKEFCEGKVQG